MPSHGQRGKRLKANKSKPGLCGGGDDREHENQFACKRLWGMDVLAGSRVAFFDIFDFLARLTPALRINYLKISIRLPFQPNEKRIFIKFHLSCTNDLFKFSLRLCRASLCAAWISRIVCVSVPARVITQKYLKGMLSYGSGS